TIVFLFSYGSREAKVMAWRMLPQPQITTLEGRHLLLDDILGTGFALLRLHHNPNEAFASLKTDFWQRLGARFICITDHTPVEVPVAQPNYGIANPLSPTVVKLEDSNFLRVKENLFFVVRPDRYIFGSFKEEK